MSNPLDNMPLDLIGDILIDSLKRRYGSDRVGLFMTIVDPNGKVESTTNMADETVNGLIDFLFESHRAGTYHTELSKPEVTQ